MSKDLLMITSESNIFVSFFPYIYHNIQLKLSFALLSISYMSQTIVFFV